MKELKKYLEIAKFTKTHGLKGETKAVYYCSNPDEFGDYKVFYLGNEKIAFKIEYYRIIKNTVIIKPEGYDSIEQAQTLLNKTLFIDRNDAELPPDTWFIQDLIGLDVIDADSGEKYGKIDEILQNAPVDVYSLKTKDNRQLLFPSIPEVLIKTDIEEGAVYIRPLEGLFDV